MLEFLIDNAVLVLAALTSGALLLWPTLRGAQAGGQAVSVSEAVRLMNREKAVLVDTRDAAAYAAGHATGARHIPLDDFSKTPFPSGLPSNKTQPVLLMCERGVRASKAAGLLRKGGYARALTIDGGMAAWREAQMPVERSAA